MLERDDVKDYLKSNYTLVTVDLSDRAGPNVALAQKAGVQAIPTIIRYDRSGQEVARSHGMPAEGLFAWLGSGR